MTDQAPASLRTDTPLGEDGSKDLGDPQAGNLLSSLRDQAPTGLDPTGFNQAQGRPSQETAS